ncbi:exosome non-catalytic core subunit rrp4 [Pichia californica]|uniref:Exosome non-catalytic core subunit rrp4 n=1 Tax=Pichia californica TaxID=460514 RepID=A0A9P7BEZ6_9ASCO|nr:exosome non-catalytic core subunit rrp4 [[Candida] californica]KAG0686838.1 exosome non-catalytic core subunit rrp4 [[Candida] californica]
MSIISITTPVSKNSEIENFSKDDEDESMYDDAIDGVLKKPEKKYIGIDNRSIVTPGELITEDATWMRGHGTYYLDEHTYSSVAGMISKVNKLLSVTPFKGRYRPETGDHIVGRVIGISNKRWKVELGAEHAGVLMLGAVNLPGGVLRRKSDNDELQMRAILKEGDLLNCEVQSTFSDGSASLHTRSLKYGKLRNGMFLKVNSSLIVRTKNHMHDLPGGVSIILGVNGYCWIFKTKNNVENKINAATGKAESEMKAASSSKGYSVGMGSLSITRLEEESSWEIYSDKNDIISANIKETISRYRSCLVALSFCEIAIDVKRLVKAYEISLGYGDVNSLVSEDIKKSIGEDLINSEKMRG